MARIISSTSTVSAGASTPKPPARFEPLQLVLFEGKLAKRKKGEAWELVVSGFSLVPVLQPVAV